MKYKIPEPHAAKARKYFLAGDFAKCESEAVVCLKELSDHHEGHFFLAQVLYKKGEKVTVLPGFRKDVLEARGK
ncbi:MAG: hypothetical protein IMZ46_03490 [Acidobacteria bacterium]|nr:hypothetical protein [Acidobacteriota bacterium]